MPMVPPRQGDRQLSPQRALAWQANIELMQCLATAYKDLLT